MDYIDIEILRLLLNNCRLPYREIGDRVKLSGQAIRRRIHKLVDNGVITSFISRGGKCGIKMEEFVGILSFAEIANSSIIMDVLLELPSVFCTVFCDSHLIF